MRARSELLVIVLALAVAAVILVGEFAVYGNAYHYDADADADGNYAVTSSGTDVYDATLFDNGSFEAVDELYIYRDGDYGSVVNKVEVEVGAPEMTQSYYIGQLENNLDYLGFDNHKRVNAEALETIVSGDATGKGIVIIAGAIPSTVYDGTADSPILSWIANGGTLYWAGGIIGQYVANPEGTVEDVGQDKQSLFLGSECCNYMEQPKFPSMLKDFALDVIDNGFRDDLSLKSDHVIYAVDTSKLADGTYLSMGYTDGTYSSIAFVEHGKGQVCVLGGNYSNNQRMDMCQIVAAGLCWQSRILDHVDGSVTRDTQEGRLDVPEAHGNLSVYIYLGGYYSVYGERFLFE